MQHHRHRARQEQQRVRQRHAAVRQRLQPQAGGKVCRCGYVEHDRRARAPRAQHERHREGAQHAPAQSRQRQRDLAPVHRQEVRRVGQPEQQRQRYQGNQHARLDGAPQIAQLRAQVVAPEQRQAGQPHSGQSVKQAAFVTPARARSSARADFVRCAHALPRAGYLTGRSRARSEQPTQVGAGRSANPDGPQHPVSEPTENYSRLRSETDANGKNEGPRPRSGRARGGRAAMHDPHFARFDPHRGGGRGGGRQHGSRDRQDAGVSRRPPRGGRHNERRQSARYRQARGGARRSRSAVRTRTSCARRPGSPSAACHPWATPRRSPCSWMPTCSASRRYGRQAEARSACSPSNRPACATSSGAKVEDLKVESRAASAAG